MIGTVIYASVDRTRLLSPPPSLTLRSMSDFLQDSLVSRDHYHFRDVALIPFISPHPTLPSAFPLSSFRNDGLLRSITQFPALNRETVSNQPIDDVKDFKGIKLKKERKRKKERKETSPTMSGAPFYRRIKGAFWKSETRRRITDFKRANPFPFFLIDETKAHFI